MTTLMKMIGMFSEMILWDEPILKMDCWVQAMLAGRFPYSPSCDVEGTYTRKQCYLERYEVAYICQSLEYFVRPLFLTSPPSLCVSIHECPQDFFMGDYILNITMKTNEGSKMKTKLLKV